MTGQELKKKIAELGVSAMTISKHLGISPQALNSTFNATDVKSGTLERIAKALGVDMSFFYPTPAAPSATGDAAVAVAGNTSDAVMGDLLDRLQALSSEVGRLQAELDHYKKAAGPATTSTTAPAHTA